MLRSPLANFRALAAQWQAYREAELARLTKFKANGHAHKQLEKRMYDSIVTFDTCQRMLEAAIAAEDARILTDGEPLPPELRWFTVWPDWYVVVGTSEHILRNVVVDGQVIRSGGMTLWWDDVTRCLPLKPGGVETAGWGVVGV